MIQIQVVSPDALLAYAARELAHFLGKLSAGPVEINSDRQSQAIIELVVSPGQAHAVQIEAGAHHARVSGAAPADVLHGVYEYLERCGVLFEFSGPQLAQQAAIEQASGAAAGINLPVFTYAHTPSFAERGIRMHLNFVQDPSCFTEAEFAGYIDNLARLKFNYLLFHMYNPQEWYPFEYQGIRHTDVAIGNLGRRPLPADMIGRERIKVREHWFPADLEHISAPEELVEAMAARYRRMMRRAKERGMTVAASIEPESLPKAFEQRLAHWQQAGLVPQLTVDWQQAWSGGSLAEVDTRSPLVIDIAVERCLALLRAFPDLDELQLISREGTAWKPVHPEDYAAEFERIRQRFGLPEGLIDLATMAEVVTEDPLSIEMNPKAHPYWTVLPGDDQRAVCAGSLRFVEFAIEILRDPRLADALAQRGIRPSLCIYSPNPTTIRLITPAVAAILPPGLKFTYLADYGASDITAGLPNWQPLFERRHNVGMVSWFEFDGCMMLAQNWAEALHANIRAAHQKGIRSICFNHWRVRSLEPGAHIAAAACFDAQAPFDDQFTAYNRRLFGAGCGELAARAGQALEAATHYAKRHNYNIGFTVDWVIRHASEPPGYSWMVLRQSAANYRRAAQAFEWLAGQSSGWGQAQAAYLRDLCQISAGHIEAVEHLQNAKLPLVGFKAWPLDNLRAAWPAPELLEVLLAHARRAHQLEEGYMRTYAAWVESCDEQGQLAMHQLGVIEPLAALVNRLAAQLNEGRNWHAA